jgi:lipoprotein-releasing system ATP-binding protein
MAIQLTVPEAAARPALTLDGIVRNFRQGGATLEVLRGASLEVAPGEAVALVGPSGAGKSTLLQIAGLLEKPDGGDVSIAGQECNRLSDMQRTALRRRRIGFVYQYHHLLPEFSALENVVLPQMIAGRSRKDAADRARRLLAHVGLEKRLTHRPARLSGGEQQRVAVARALANRPLLLIADEPTGNLDQHTADQVFELLLGLVKRGGLAALIATHNHDLAGRMDRVLALREGAVAPA